MKVTFAPDEETFAGNNVFISKNFNQIWYKKHR